MPPKKLLIADDSLTIQKVIRLALSGAAAAASAPAEGYDIQAVSDGNDAIQQISLFRPHVVLIDVSLPGKTAVEVKHSVNQHRDLDDIRFVLMSSAFEKVDEHEVTESGFHGRLTKPFDPAHLREVLSEVLSQVPDRQPPAEHTMSIQPPLPPGSSESRTAQYDDAPAEPEDNPPQLQRKPPSPPPLPIATPPAFAAFSDQASAARRDSNDQASATRRDSKNHDSDIKHLTESTIRMSGLADLDSPPSPPPPPADHRQEGTFQNPSQDFQEQANPNEFNWDVKEPSRKADGRPDVRADSLILDFSSSAIPPHPPKDFPVDLNAEIPPPLPEKQDLSSHSDESQSRASITYPFTTPPSPPEPAPSPEASHANVQEMIRAEVEKTLRKMAQEALPQVAEKILKEEIRKLLTEGP